MDESEAVRTVREHLEGQFPRRCPGCGREFVTLRDYLASTHHVGDPISEDLEADGDGDASPGMAISLAMCACGTTMGLDSEGIAVPTRLRLALYARAEARRRGVSFRRFLRELREQIDRQVLAEPPPPAHARQAPPVDRAAELYEKTMATVRHDLRRVVTWTLALSAAGLILRTTSFGAILAWAVLASLTAVLWLFRGRPRQVTMLAVGLLELVLIFLLLNFGPTAGTGALVAVGVLVASSRLGRGAGVGFALVATVSFCAVGALVTHRGGPSDPAFAIWVRTGVMCGALSVFIALATSSLLRGLRGALTELDQARRVNERAQAELARRRELETAGRLVGGVAHDVNNSLTVVACCADELRDESLSPSALELVGDIQTTIRAATGTMRAVLDLVRPAGGEAPRCDPARVIAEVGRNLQRLLPDDVKLATSLIEGHTVPLTRGALLQTTMNLVLNARDALEGEPKEISLAVEPSEGSVVVSVRDTGRGMDPATLARLGEPFFSTKGRAGTGLGLSMVRATVEACGGRLVFESEPGRGTEVRMVLPKAAPSAEEADVVVTGAVTGKRVLLVEDDATIRRAFARGLSAAGAKVTEAASVARAKVEITQAGPAFDILVCDGVLEDGTIGDVIAPFRERYATAPMLLCTGHGPEVFVARGIALTGTTMIAKPISGAQLAREAARALGGERTGLVSGEPGPPIA